jgi:hypothetical protein
VQEIIAISIALCVLSVLLWWRAQRGRGDVRLKVFQRLLSVIQPVMRKRRIRNMLSLLDLQPGERIIDLGGSSSMLVCRSTLR